MAWLVNDLFQQSKIQTGIKKAVNKIIISDRPSIPRTMLILIELNQEVVSRNWKCVDVVSKKNNKVTQTLRISKDQKSEKLRIKLISVLLVKTRTKQANKGREIIVDNSIKKLKKGKTLIKQLLI